MTGHDHWDEQAAGYALDALDPGERSEFERHLAGCAECRANVDEHALVAAQLGALAYDERPAPAWDSIRPAIVDTAAQAPTNVVPLRRFRRSAVVASVVTAAAAAAVVAGVVWPGGSSIEQLAALRSVSACVHTTGCHVVALSTDGRGTASVLVYRRAVAVRSDTMRSAPQDSQWVLWQLPKNGVPAYLASFGDADGAQAVLRVAYADTSGFAISREPAGTTPTAPSVVVASGTV